MMGYRKCYDCGRVFKTSRIIDKTLQKQDVPIYCPRCGSTEIYTISKEMYEKEEDKR